MNKLKTTIAILTATLALAGCGQQAVALPK